MRNQLFHFIKDWPSLDPRHMTKGGHHVYPWSWELGFRKQPSGFRIPESVVQSPRRAAHWPNLDQVTIMTNQLRPGVG